MFKVESDITLKIEHTETGATRDVDVWIDKTEQPFMILCRTDVGPRKREIFGYALKIQGFESFEFILAYGKFTNPTVVQWTVSEKSTGYSLASHENHNVAVLLTVGKLFKVKHEGFRKLLEVHP